MKSQVKETEYVTSTIWRYWHIRSSFNRKATLCGLEIPTMAQHNIKLSGKLCPHCLAKNNVRH